MKETGAAIARVKESMDMAETQAAIDAGSAMTDDGKRKYTSDKKVAIGAKSALDKNEDYIAYKNTLHALETKKATAVANAEHYEGQLKLFRIRARSLSAIVELVAANLKGDK